MRQAAERGKSGVCLKSLTKQTPPQDRMKRCKAVLMCVIVALEMWRNEKKVRTFNHRHKIKSKNLHKCFFIRCVGVMLDMTWYLNQSNLQIFLTGTRQSVLFGHWQTWNNTNLISSKNSILCVTHYQIRCVCHKNPLWRERLCHHF